MKADEYFNQLPPLGNNAGMVSQQVLRLTETPTSIDLRTLFGSIGDQHGLAFKADFVGRTLPSGTATPAVYFNLTPNPASITHGMSGVVASGVTIGWPLADKEEKLCRPISGRGVGTGALASGMQGFATAMNYVTLNAFATEPGYLRIMRATLLEGQDASKLRPPQPSGVYPPGPSGWSPLPM